MLGKINLNDYRYHYSSKGFCSIINQVIDIATLHNKTHGDFNVIVEDPQILKLFNNLNSPIGETYEAGVLFLENFFNGQIDNSFNAHTIPNYDSLKTKNNVLNKILKIKPEILEIFDKELRLLFNNEEYLGVQVRGTDKKNEIKEIPYGKIIEGIDAALNETNLKKLFLATDDIKYVNLIKTKYGNDMVIINESNTFSFDSKPIHFTNDRNKSNLEVLKDVYFLKNSSYLCYTYSNVGYLAMIMGFDKIKGFKILNNI